MELNFLEIFGTIVGLVYLWLEYRASIYLWIAGIVMPAIYIFVYYKAGLYADFGINIYYLIAAIYDIGLAWMIVQLHIIILYELQPYPLPEVRLLLGKMYFKLL